MIKPYLGMYVHQHWAYHYPYAARIWTLNDWRGYASGLHALGYNMIQIWPMTDFMPEALTTSDRAQLAKTQQIIAMLQDEFDMAVLIAFTPNCLGNEHAAAYSFEERPFFETEDRLNPGDPDEFARLITFRRMIMSYLGHADGFTIIDSDPGGYIGSTNAEFVELLWAHLAMINTVNPQAILYYWMWHGWEGYNRYLQRLQGGKPAASPGKNDWADVITGLLQHPERRWALMSCNANHHPLITTYHVGERTLFNPYNVVEYEPSIPMTNYTPAAIQQELALPVRHTMRLGAMANAQTHVAQLPNTYLFAHYAQGGTPESVGLLGFAEGLLPGYGQLIATAWEAIGRDQITDLLASAAAIDMVMGATYQQGPYSGLLIGGPQRFLEDLVMQVRFRASILGFAQAMRHGSDWRNTLGNLHAIWSTWQQRTGFTDFFMGAVDELLYEPLHALHNPPIDAILADLHDWDKLYVRHGIAHRLVHAIGEVLSAPQ